MIKDLNLTKPSANVTINKKHKARSDIGIHHIINKNILFVGKKIILKNKRQVSIRNTEKKYITKLLKTYIHALSVPVCLSFLKGYTNATGTKFCIRDHLLFLILSRKQLY